MKKIKRANIITYSAPDDIAEVLKGIPKGKKSHLITTALRKYLAETGKELELPTKEITVKGLTSTEITDRIDHYMMKKHIRLLREFVDKIAEAKRKGNDPDLSWEEKQEGDYERKFYEYREKYDDLNLKGDDYLNWLKTLTLEDIEKTLFFSKPTIIKKVVPLLQNRGYKVVKQKDKKEHSY